MALPAWNILRGKAAAITGGSGTAGIGRAIALEYIRQTDRDAMLR
jgi:NAD(P)-dependent dehydrogenase (short-subunit alcohol dehydrogenase family)